ncbi:MAG: hypothetical protein HN855_08265 [Anaerolineae bacterium]|jgi:hypothetical protein|nr:hypothetical protein [Anaerolineae bacterium]MBT7069460.1 hypothetical protein [Anaerolineae bacterium]MBT7325137.1 hypothetical protein [Anaerolineae bacterium]
MNPLLSFLKTHWYLLTGRLHFPKERVGESFALEDFQEFTIFRQVIVDPPEGELPKPSALFRVRFRVANMSPEQNKYFSILPIPFFIGLPGFRSKLWMHDHVTGESQGVYHWDTLEDAQNYVNSFAMKFMNRRAVAGSIFHEVRLISEK